MVWTVLPLSFVFHFSLHLPLPRHLTLPSGPISSRFQRRTPSSKRKTQFFSVATKGPCQLSRSQPTALPAPNWQPQEEVPAGRAGLAAAREHLGRGWRPNGRERCGGGALASSRPPPVGDSTPGTCGQRCAAWGRAREAGPPSRPGLLRPAAPAECAVLRRARIVCQAVPRRRPSDADPRVPGLASPAGQRAPGAPLPPRASPLPASPQPAPRPSRRRARSMARSQVPAFGLLFAAATVAVAVAQKGKEQSCGLGRVGDVPRHPRPRWWARGGRPRFPVWSGPRGADAAQALCAREAAGRLPLARPRGSRLTSPLCTALQDNGPEQGRGAGREQSGQVRGLFGLGVGQGGQGGPGRRGCRTPSERAHVLRPGRALGGVLVGRKLAAAGRGVGGHQSLARPSPRHLWLAPDVSLGRGQVAAGRPPGPLRTCAREQVLLGLHDLAWECGCLLFFKDRVGNAKFIVGNPEISISVKRKNKPTIPTL